MCVWCFLCRLLTEQTEQAREDLKGLEDAVVRQQDGHLPSMQWFWLAASVLASYPPLIPPSSRPPLAPPTSGFSNTRCRLALAGQRAADAAQPAQTLCPGPHGAREEGSSSSSGCEHTDTFLCLEDSSCVLCVLRAPSWTARRESATWPRSRRSPSWRTTWSSSPRSTSRYCDPTCTTCCSGGNLSG